MDLTPQTPPLANLPSVMAFRRAFVISDAPFHYVDANGQSVPVPVLRHGTMGTQNVNEKPRAGATTVAGGERDVRNLQEVETAKTGADMQVVEVAFQMKAIDLAEALHSCSNAKSGLMAESEQMRAMIRDFVARAKKSEGLEEVARRVARNVLNGRWLWRNRVMASAVRIDVQAGARTWSVDALRIPLSGFDAYSDAERELGAEIAEQMRGESIDEVAVKATVDFGVKGAIEVFGSQNYEPKRERPGSREQGLSRSLYKIGVADSKSAEGVRVVGQAAFRDAKVWNALRTIDTWYQDYTHVGMPMPVEPLGASLSLSRFVREKKDSAFDMFKRLHRIDPASDEGMFCIGIIMRGGVLGEEEKSRKSTTDDGGQLGDADPV